MAYTNTKEHRFGFNSKLKASNFIKIKEIIKYLQKFNSTYRDIRGYWTFQGLEYESKFFPQIYLPSFFGYRTYIVFVIIYST